MYKTPAQLEPAEREKIITFLRSRPVGVLATTDADGNPHASAIYFSVDDDLRITFTTKQGTAKYANMQRHNTVMLVVFEAESQTSVQVSGKAVEVTDPHDQQEIYRGTLDATRQTGKDVVPPIAKIPAGNYASFQIDIQNIVLSEYGWGDTFAKAMQHADRPNATGDPA